MKENEKLITILNQILVEELNTTNQNIFRCKVSDDLDYRELYEEIEKETTEELKQAEWLIKRIIFLEVCRRRQPSITEILNNPKDNYEKRSKVG